MTAIVTCIESDAAALIRSTNTDGVCLEESMESVAKKTVELFPRPFSEIKHLKINEFWILVFAGIAHNPPVVHFAGGSMRLPLGVN